MSQKAYPASDIDSVWVCSSGTARWSLIDEVTPDDDTTYIRCNWSTNEAQTVKLQASTDPTIHSNHIIHCRAKLQRSPPNGSHAGRLNLYLMQGATQICVNLKTFPDTSTYQDLSYTLQVSEAANISDYTDLRIKLGSENCGDMYSVWVTQAYLEVPGVPKTYPTDPLLRVTGITRTFWPGKKIYQMQINIGGNGASYIPPVDNINFIPAIPPLVTPQVQQQGINTAFIDAINQARGVGQQSGNNYINPTTNPGIPNVPNPLPNTPGAIGNPPGNSPFVTGNTTPFQITGPELYLDPSTGKLTRRKPK